MPRKKKDNRSRPRAFALRHPGSGAARRTEARLKAGLSQAEVASRMGVSREIITRWETRGNPSTTNVVRLAAAIGCRTDDLLPRAEDLGD